MADGPKTMAVRATLPSRPAGIVNAMSHEVVNCFAGLFNGASEGHIWPNGAFKCGKAECEWHFPQAWDALRDAGLIEYRIEERPNHPDIGGTTKYVPWSITDKGWSVREDDNAFFREMMAAGREDRAALKDSKDA